MQEGFHDVFFVIVKYPTIKSLDEDFRKSTDMSNLLFIRFNITVDTNITPLFNLNKFGNSKATVFDGVFLSKEKDELRRWCTEDLDIYNCDIETGIRVGINVK